MNKLSRFLAIIISMSMIFSSSGVVLAAEKITHSISMENRRGEMIKGTLYEGDVNNKLRYSGGNHIITLKNASVDHMSSESSIDVIDGATLEIYLIGDNEVTGAGNGTLINHPAIWVEEGSTLIIRDGSGNGTGKLVANAKRSSTFGGYAAGIGGSNGAGGNIVIESGCVYAYGEQSIKGNFSTGSNGNAVVVAPDGITDQSNKSNWSGIFALNSSSDENTINVTEDSISINNNSATVYGNITSNKDITVNNGTTLNVGEADQVAKLDMQSGTSLTNNGTVNIAKGTVNIAKSSEIIFIGGKDQIKGNGNVVLNNTGLIRVPLTEDMVSTKDLSFEYTGKAPSAEVSVKLETPWKTGSSTYTKTYAKDEDYTLDYGSDFNVGSKNLTVSAELGGDLLNPSSVTKGYQITQADYRVNVPPTWSVKQGETELLTRLPKTNITTNVEDNYIGNLKKGTLKWYTDETRTTEVNNETLKSNSVDEKITLYWKYTQSDANFVSEKTGSTEVTITKEDPMTVIIKREDGSVVENEGHIVYGDTREGLRVFLKDSAGKEKEITNDPDYTITWSATSGNDHINLYPGANGTENIEAVKATEENERVSLKINVSRAGVAEVNGYVPVEIQKREVSATIKSCTDRAYDGTLDVDVKASLNQESGVTGILTEDVNDVILSSVGKLESAGAGDNKKVNVKFSISGDKASNYVLNPTTATSTVKISEMTTGTIPAGKTVNLTIKNKQESEYKFDLSKLVPDKVGNIEIGTCTFTASADSDGSNYIDSKGLSISGNTLTVPVKYVDSTKTGNVGTITVKINGANFDTTGTINLVAENISSGGGGGTITPPKDPSKPDDEIIGDDRYDTAGKIADSMGDYDSAILVNATKTLSDGLSAASISGKEKAPILLTKKDSIPEATMKRLAKAKTVYIIGGEEAISKKVESQLKGKKIIRLGGDTRFETSLEIEEYIGDYDKAFIVNGYTGEADAMSASAAAAKYNAPIILTNGKSSEYKKESGVSYYAIGGKTVLSDNIVKTYSAKRIGGSDRYKTNRMFIEEFYPYSATYYFTKGEPLVDALTASYIARNSGVVLVSKNSDNSILKGKELIQIGGMPFSILPLK